MTTGAEGSGGTPIGAIWQIGKGVADWLNRNSGLSAGERAAIETARGAGYERVPYRGRLVYRTPEGRITTERNVIEAGRRIGAAPPAQPPVFGQPTPPRPSPILGEVERVLRESPKSRRKRLRKLSRREQWQRWIAIGRAKLPKGVVKRLPDVIRRAPKVGAYGVGPSIAWKVGYWIGTAIYERGTAWYYGDTAGRPKIPTARPAPAEHPHPTARPPTVPATARPAPPRPQPRPGVPIARPTAPTSAPQLHDVVITARRVAVPSPASVPAPRSAATVPRIRQVARVLGAAASVYSLVPPRRRAPGRIADSLTFPAPLTGLQPQPVASGQRRVPKVKTDACECEKPRRKSGKKPCRNPIVKRSRTTRGGRRYSTVTRELTCQPSSRKKPR